MIKISKINWLDKSANEAEVTVTDGKYDIVCFSHPFVCAEDTNKYTLYCTNIDNIIRAEKRNFAVFKLEGAYNYRMKGQLTNQKKSIRVGGLLFDISDTKIPGDIREGDFIEMMVGRVDIY